MDGPIFQWESNNDGQPNLWFGFSNKFNAYLGPPEHIEDVGTGSHRIQCNSFKKQTKLFKDFCPRLQNVFLIELEQKKIASEIIWFLDFVFLLNYLN